MDGKAGGQCPVGEHIYRFGIEELQVIRLKFANKTVRELPVELAANEDFVYHEAIEPEVAGELRKLCEAIRFFAPKGSPTIEFVLKARE